MDINEPHHRRGLRWLDDEVSKAETELAWAAMHRPRSSGLRSKAPFGCPSSVAATDNTNFALKPRGYFAPGRILKATELWPRTPAEIYYWTFAWLHALAYGEEAKTRKRWQRFYGRMPDEKRGLFPDWDDVAWVLKYDDIETLIEEELDEDEKRRHRALP